MKIVFVILAVILGLLALLGVNLGELTAVRELAIGLILAALAHVVP